ncbi:MAG: DUF541 domain-containing protein [Limimaricola sp.]|uniref:SIMPL domain-containing protein n=1 Tax=Limimaricola sp. TaxID=2211665 RepID=UPI001DAD5CDF|nr:SIMPL domain-containing protein [Limimaricola sp.]MBI1416563.1 DUF541 domain-containing protein [Limimaricola sp.]
MGRSVWRKGLVLALVLGTAWFAGIEPVQAQAARTISVTGEGQSAAKPDMAAIRLGVSKDAPSASDAVAAMSADMAQVLAALKEAGIADIDLQTSGLSLNERYSRPDENGNTTLVGFTASTDLTVRVRDLDKLGSILDTVVRTGANRLNGISFDLQDPGPATDAARRAAVADGIARARLYAAAAGVTLGPLLTLDEAGGGSPTPVMMEARFAAAPVPVAAGEVSVSASVQMTFAIGD